MGELLQIVPLALDTAPSLWPYVRESLKRVEEQMGDVALPERVYADWAAGRAKVFTIRWGGELTGALVLTGPELTAAMKRRLWVWALAINQITSDELRAAINDWLLHAARKCGAASVGMASPREGWGRPLKSLGWKPVQVEYELEVNHG